ncbi:hypothetical protein Tsubulata_032288 [Turnera subulata]|uniref:NAD-dependent epimerase/dehydratase domain-containing protein n=1 Tax=Turnera subulata TaxID=218843 RepID=A0A9Q0J306_9ROSI|nr:hypothetical protein Tsubulata_032288 [Turnera subulata]
MSGEGKVVCVTGASGYIASWLVNFLLQRGYTVKATVRDPNDPKKTEHLRALDGADERLLLLKAGLLEDGAFDSVVDGCEGVFHTASPVSFSVQNPQDELVEPAVKGTLNVLRSCAKSPSVKRVVLTASMASVSENGKPLTPDVVVDETWFSDPAYCESNKACFWADFLTQPFYFHCCFLYVCIAWFYLSSVFFVKVRTLINFTRISLLPFVPFQLWYRLSKTLAEEAAWKFTKANGIDMVVINPSWVIGPLLQPTINATVEVFLKDIHGAQTFPNKNYRFVDVRDVAKAHVEAFERASASGRYCLVGKVIHVSEALKIVHQLYPSLTLPMKCEDDKPFVPKYEVSKEKAKQLGINFTPLEVTIKDTIDCLKEKGMISL